MFVLSRLLDDVFSTQAKERSFSYSWLLILIALVTWMESEDYQLVSVSAENVCKGTWY